MLEKKKLRDIAESISGIRPENRSLEGIVSFIEEQANIVYEKQPRTFLGRLRELGYALNGVRPTQRSLRGIVNAIYEGFSPVPPVPPVSNKIYGVSGMFDINTSLTRTDDAVGMTYTKNLDGTITSDFDDVFPYNEMKDITIPNVDGLYNVFVEIPSMWFRVGVDNDKNITDIAVSKSKGKGENWYETKKFYYAKYCGFANPSNQIVFSGTVVTPTKEIVVSNARKWCANNGVGYQILDLYHRTIINFLFLIEFANKNIRTLFPMTFDELQYCGGTDGIETPSGVLGNGRLKWHGIEDLFGNVREFIEGIRGNYYATANASDFGDDISKYSKLSYEPSMIGANLTICSFGWDKNNPFMVMPKSLSQYNLTSYFTQIASPTDDTSFYYDCGTNYLTNVAMGNALLTIKNTNQSTIATQGIGVRLLYCPNGV